VDYSLDLFINFLAEFREEIGFWQSNKILLRYVGWFLAVVLEKFLLNVDLSPPLNVVR
jgi:hypothetical protein